MKRLIWISVLIALGVIALQAEKTRQFIAKADNSGGADYSIVFQPVGFEKSCEPSGTATLNFAETLPGLISSMKTQSILQSQSNGAALQAKKHAQSRLRGRTEGVREVFMTVELPEEASDVLSGRLTKAVSYRDPNLLLENEQDQRMLSLKLEEDKKTVEFTVAVREPERRTRYLTEVAGTLEYLAAAGSKLIDSGPVGFKTGARSALLGIGIGSVRPSLSDKDQVTVELALDVPNEKIKTTKFYDANGTELAISESKWQTVEGKTTGYFSIKGKLPPKGRIVLEVSEEPEKKTHSFELSRVPLRSARSARRGADRPDAKSLRDMLRRNSDPNLSAPEVDGARRRTLRRASEREPEADYSTPVSTQLQEATRKRREGDLDGAIRICKQVIANTEASPRHMARAYHYMGMCYLSKGDKQMAAEQFEQIISEFPFLQKESARASRMLSRIKPREDERSSPRDAPSNGRFSRRGTRSSSRQSFR